MVIILFYILWIMSSFYVWYTFSKIIYISKTKDLRDEIIKDLDMTVEKYYNKSFEE